MSVMVLNLFVFCIYGEFGVVINADSFDHVIPIGLSLPVVYLFGSSRLIYDCGRTS